jgi:hypothetical protein
MRADHPDLIAIDVLLVPDRRMIDKVESLNAQLRKDYPAGYALNAKRIPHVTLLQRFVTIKDIKDLCATIAKILNGQPPATMTLKATSIDSVSFDGLAIAVLDIERTPELMRLHQKVADAVGPFSVGGGSPAAFADSTVAAGTVEWVETFIPKASGENYQPHVTAGIATETFVAQLKAAPFLPFAFKADALAVFQLGNFGTAAKKLWQC